jgi:hypothetical protein
MTCFIHYDGRYYADSTIVKGDESFESTTKIVRLNDPLPIKVSKDDPSQMEIDDVVYGWFGTGTLQVMQRFVETLQHFPGEKAGIALSPYRMAAAAHLVTRENNFEIVLVGAAKDHKFELFSHFFEYTSYGKDEVYAVGGGSNYAWNYLKSHGDPIRAMLETSMVDLNTGGMIDCWALEDRENGVRVFRRQGLHESVPRDMVVAYLSNFKVLVEKIPLMFERRSTVVKEMIAEADAAMKKKPAAKKVVVKKKVAAKKTPVKTVRKVK